MNRKKKSLTVIKTLVIGEEEKGKYKRSFEKFLEKNSCKLLPVYLLSEYLQENELCYDDIIISEKVSHLEKKYPKDNIMTNGLKFNQTMEVIHQVHDIKYSPNEISSAFVDVFDTEQKGKVHIDKIKAALWNKGSPMEFDTIMHHLSPDSEGYVDYNRYALRGSYRGKS